MTAKAVLCLAATLLPALTLAQVRVVRYGDDRLTGIRTLDALVTIESGTNACTPAKSALQRTVLDTLRDGGVTATLSERARSTAHSVVTRIRSAATGSACATSVDTALVAEVHGIPEADAAAPPGTWGSLLVGTMNLAEEEMLVTARAEEHDAAVQRAVRDQVAGIAARLRQANP